MSTTDKAFNEPTDASAVSKEPASPKPKPQPAEKIALSHEITQSVQQTSKDG